MLADVLLAILIGCCFGIITGLIPGIHINLVSLLLVSASGYLLGFTNELVLGVFIVAMSVTHTFLDTVPSVFLGAPDADTALAVLPGHRMLLEGRGYDAVKLTVIGSLFCLFLTTAIIPVLIPAVPAIYSFISPWIGWILIAVTAYMTLAEKKKWMHGLFVFFLSGVLGIIVLNIPNFPQPLFPMLSGLFGISILLTSLSSKVKIPKQVISKKLEINKKDIIKSVSAGTFSGSLTALFPGLGAAQAAIIGMNLIGKKAGDYAFMILVGGVNTVNFIFSLVTFYTLNKSRNGAVVALSEILKRINISYLVVFLATVLIVGGIATFLALSISKIFSKFITKINYQAVCISIIALISILVLCFSGLLGFFVLCVSTAVGLIPSLTGVKKSLAMGCLLLPVILYFI
jgi:putative membrane protein